MEFGITHKLFLLDTEHSCTLFQLFQAAMISGDKKRPSETLNYDAYDLVTHAAPPPLVVPPLVAPLSFQFHPERRLLQLQQDVHHRRMELQF